MEKASDRYNSPWLDRCPGRLHLGASSHHEFRPPSFYFWFSLGVTVLLVILVGGAAITPSRSRT